MNGEPPLTVAQARVRILANVSKDRPIDAVGLERVPSSNDLAGFVQDLVVDLDRIATDREHDRCAPELVRRMALRTRHVRGR